MAARTDRRARGLGAALGLALVLGLFPAAGRGDGPVTPPERPYVEELRARFSYFHQDGRGLQSQADPRPSGGSQRLDVYQPMLLLGLRQSPDVRHTLIVPVDVVTAASADALDAVSHASRTNEHLGFTAQTDWSVGRDQHLTFLGGYAREEPLRSMTAGVGFTQDLAEDNAAISLTGNAIFDLFDPIEPNGFDPGYVRRAALNLNVSVSQILSRTTLGVLSYGVTHQWGVLEQTWNAVPVRCDAIDPCPAFAAEVFPSTRTRHALSALLAQRIVPTDSTLRLRYRFYSDDVGIVGHTLESELYQYVTRRAYLVMRYRYHRQSAAGFFVRSIDEAALAGDTPRTADSDLAAFDAHEWGVRALVYLSDPRRGPSHTLDVGYLRYLRTNDLRMSVTTLGYSRMF